ncbi:glycerol-3-phosphate acyltransferase, partial [Acinetobacter baumannii]
MTAVLQYLAAYLVGSVPFGVMIARAKGVDITSVGSGNIGATNVGRTLGRGAGLLTFVLDTGKGA